MRRDKREDRHLRIIYTRVLERTLSKTVSYLQNEQNNDKDKFISFIEVLDKAYQKCQKVPLDSEYYNSLEKLVLIILNLPKKEFNLDETRIEITREANRLKKLQRVKKRKRDKHRKREFDDGN